MVSRIRAKCSAAAASGAFLFVHEFRGRLPIQLSETPQTGTSSRIDLPKIVTMNGPK